MFRLLRSESHIRYSDRREEHPVETHPGKAESADVDERLEYPRAHLGGNQIIARLVLFDHIQPTQLLQVVERNAGARESENPFWTSRTPTGFPCFSMYMYTLRVFPRSSYSIFSVSAMSQQPTNKRKVLLSQRIRRRPRLSRMTSLPRARRALSVAFPDTILEERHDSLREKTIKLGQIARTCSIFGVDTIQVFPDQRGGGESALIKSILEYPSRHRST